MKRKQCKFVGCPNEAIIEYCALHDPELRKERGEKHTFRITQVGKTRWPDPHPNQPGWVGKPRHAELPPPTKPKNQWKPPSPTLKVGQYKLLESIEHMRYYVLRSVKGYHSVVISLCGTIPDSMIKKQARLRIINHWMSKAHKTFDEAESHFWRGGETFWRIKDRIKRTRDPNWIPPNLRKTAWMAVHVDPGYWDLIPEHELPRLKAWAAQGCPGWHEAPSRFNKDDKWDKQF